MWIEDMISPGWVDVDGMIIYDYESWYIMEVLLRGGWVEVAVLR